jgi:phosphoglycerate kinase
MVSGPMSKESGSNDYDFLTLDDVETSGKRIFLRVDINVPIDPSTDEILDDTRIRAISDTLKELEDARVVLGSHQSRPGKDDFTSLEPHSQRLARYCSQDVGFVDDVMGAQARQKILKVKPGEVLVLDNLRFCAEENLDEKPDKLVKTHLVKRFAKLFDLNVNDAFATAHRSQPTLVGLPEVLPSVAGRLMERELKAVSMLLVKPERPCVYVLGGSKFEDKIPVMEHILASGKVDSVLLGGVPGKVFLRTMSPNLPLGDSLPPDIEKEMNRARIILKKYGEHIQVPVDLAYAMKGKRMDYPMSSLPNDGAALDIGTRTVEKYSKIIDGAATVVANGPLGVFERDGFDLGTKTILESIARNNGYTVIGGGHLIGLASIEGMDDKFRHVSTAGGAMLSLLAGQRLPGIDALVRAAARMRAEGVQTSKRTG